MNIFSIPNLVATTSQVSTTTNTSTQTMIWNFNILENLGILAIGLFIGFFDDIFSHSANEVITTTMATTTTAPSSGVSDVIVASGGFLAGILFLSLIELIANRPNQILASHFLVRIEIA